MAFVLFVCIGNSCRSPMAEVLARRHWDGLCRGLTVGSAGLAALAGAPASHLAQAVADEQGGDLGAHRTRRVSARLVEASDLVVTMTGAQKAELVGRFPEARERLFTLGELARSGRAAPPEVGDPWGEDLEEYRRVWAQIDELIEAAAPAVKAFLDERGACP